MRTATLPKFESSNVDETFILVLPTEKGRGKIYLREWICLQLVYLGYKVLNIEDFIFGRFPSQINVRPNGNESEERRASFINFLKKFNVEIKGLSLEAVK